MEPAADVRKSEPRQNWMSQNSMSQSTRSTSRRPVATHFNTACSVCGRRLLVPIEQMGRTLACGHCGCQFVAADPDSAVHAGPSLLEKADQQLARLRGAGSP